MLNCDTARRLETEEHSSSNGSVEEMPKKKKWGKIGAPKSEKRKKWLAKIRKLRRKGVRKYTPRYKVKKKRKR